MDEERKARALASGLRVVSASDDPSGLAIAETIQTKVSGLQQGVQNVQNANNLLSVADSTLENVQKILSRVHTLIIEASSDLNSVGQLQSIQTEIEALLQEVNKIAGDANFNGKKLFDGSLATFSSAFNQAPFAEPVHPFEANSGPNVYDATGAGSPNAGPLISIGPNAYNGSASGFVPGLVEFKVTGYDSNPTDPVTGPLGAPGVYIQITEYSTNPNFGGTGGAQEQVSTSAFYTGAGVDQGTGLSLFVSSANGALNMLKFDLANLSPQDVGTAMAFETFDATPAPSGNALAINSSGAEGGVVQISLPSVSTAALGISAITVMPVNVVDWQNNPLGTGNNQAATADAEARVQNALDAISHARAQVGAQSVSLNEDADNASLDVVNQVASESAIRDVNIGQTSAEFIKDQVLSQIGVSVLSQMQVNANLVLQLFAATASPQSNSQSSSSA
jgi:flagellin